PVINERKKQDQADSGGFISRYGVTPPELAHLRVLSPEIEEIVPLREVRKDVWARDVKTDIAVVGTSPALVEGLDYHPESGRFLTTLDERNARPVCVLGAEARRKLFRTRSWSGEQVKVGTEFFQVVGVMEEKPGKGSGGALMEDPNNQIYVPYTTVMSVF